MTTQTSWDNQHERYTKMDWIDKPSLFAEWAIGYFPPQGKILELGCGQGQDSRFFAGHGYTVTALDFSEKGIAYAQEKAPATLRECIDFHVADISRPLDFADNSFDIMYSHLALHYFDHATTQKIFAEIHRILKPGGMLAFLVNSADDPEYGTGQKLENDYYVIGDIKKRYFSIESTKEFTKDFTLVVLDNHGETYKDRAIGTQHLIRFVGKK